MQCTNCFSLMNSCPLKINVLQSHLILLECITKQCIIHEVEEVRASGGHGPLENIRPSIRYKAYPHIGRKIWVREPKKIV